MKAPLLFSITLNEKQKAYFENIIGMSDGVEYEANLHLVLTNEQLYITFPKITWLDRLSVFIRKFIG